MNRKSVPVKGETPTFVVPVSGTTKYVVPSLTYPCGKSSLETNGRSAYDLQKCVTWKTNMEEMDSRKRNYLNSSKTMWKEWNIVPKASRCRYSHSEGKKKKSFSSKFQYILCKRSNSSEARVTNHNFRKAPTFSTLQSRFCMHGFRNGVSSQTEIWDSSQMVPVPT